MTSISMARAPRSLRAPLVRLLSDHIALTFLVWVGYLVVVLVGTAVASNWTDITQSTWQEAASQVPRWFALFIGIRVGHDLLPLHVAYGQTRREFSAMGAVFILVFATAAALMVTAGFVFEAGLYEVTGWPQSIEERHLYSSAWELHLIFTEAWLPLALWTAGGAFIGVAFYRESGLGGLAIGVCIVIAGVAGIILDGDWGPFGGVYERLTGDNEVHPAIGIPAYLGCIALVAGMAWLTVRDIPLRNKAA